MPDCVRHPTLLFMNLRTASPSRARQSSLPAKHQPGPSFQSMRKKMIVHYLTVNADLLPTRNTASTASLPSRTDGLVLDLKASEETWVRVLQDDEVSFEGTILAGESESFRATDYIT